MQFLVIGALAAVSSSTAIATNKGGYLPGETVGVLISSPGGAFAGAAQLQTSVDNTTWVNVGAATANTGVSLQLITLSNFIRLNCTAVTAGSVSAVLIGSAD